jgi:hypothetical protein
MSEDKIQGGKNGADPAPVHREVTWFCCGQDRKSKFCPECGMNKVNVHTLQSLIVYLKTQADMHQYKHKEFVKSAIHLRTEWKDEKRAKFRDSLASSHKSKADKYQSWLNILLEM